RRGESDELILKPSAPNTWTGTIPTYVFVERGADRKRLPATGIVSVSLADAVAGPQAQIEISYAPPGDTNLPPAGTLIEATDGGTYRVHLSGSVKLAQKNGTQPLATAPTTTSGPAT